MTEQGPEPLAPGAQSGVWVCCLLGSCWLPRPSGCGAAVHGSSEDPSCTARATALDFTSITSHIHNWVLFLLWLCLFILSGVISPLISSSILGTYRPGEFLFQFPIFLPFHAVHGVLKARILKWFAIPFSSGSRLVRTLHHDPSVLGGPTWHGPDNHVKVMGIPDNLSRLPGEISITSDMQMTPPLWQKVKRN